MEDFSTGGEKVESKPKSKPRYVPEVVVGAGYLLFFVLLTVACVAVFMMYPSRTAQQKGVTIIPTIKSSPTITSSPTSLPPSAPTPHILSTPAMNAPGVFADDFSDNSNQWGNIYFWKLRSEVQGGKLSLSGPSLGHYGLVTCAPCQQMSGPYYIQADFATGGAADIYFGVAVRFHAHEGHFHVFMINPKSRNYLFYYVPTTNTDHWYSRASGHSYAIRPFPATNVIGVYAGKGLLEFYVNGQFVDSYHESGIAFDSEAIGLYFDGGGPKVLIDNLIVQHLGGE